MRITSIPPDPPPNWSTSSGANGRKVASISPVRRAVNVVEGSSITGTSSAATSGAPAK